jgi:hypothetical protein
MLEESVHALEVALQKSGFAGLHLRQFQGPGGREQFRIV